MSSFTLTDDYDIAITNNSMTLNTGLESIRQHLEVKFQIFLGEWFLDTSVGVPWFEDILQKHPTFVIVQEALKNVILTTEGVTEILEFDFDYIGSSRTVTLEFRAVTDLGIIDFTNNVTI